MEMKKTKVKMNKPVYLGKSILDINKTLTYDFWYDYLKPKYNNKAKLCYMNTDSFVLNIFTEDFFEDINNDVKKWFDTSSYDKNDKRPLQIGVNKKVIGMFKGELGGKIMKEFCTVRAKQAWSHDHNPDIGSIWNFFYLGSYLGSVCCLDEPKSQF